ncbi:hypothetical protein GQ44DRAFT_713938 [Phaeosphaeriaceae sp. PMI808]|nr:hypothetical protein GQ44DRAFT_713938 [Phaeosphaeriaceae sp. PMI808]
MLMGMGMGSSLMLCRRKGMGKWVVFCVMKCFVMGIEMGSAIWMGMGMGLRKLMSRLVILMAMANWSLGLSGRGLLGLLFGLGRFSY